MQGITVLKLHRRTDRYLWISLGVPLKETLVGVCNSWVANVLIQKINVTFYVVQVRCAEKWKVSHPQITCEKM